MMPSVPGGDPYSFALRAAYSGLSGSQGPPRKKRPCVPNCVRISSSHDACANSNTGVKSAARNRAASMLPRKRSSPSKLSVIVLMRSPPWRPGRRHALQQPIGGPARAIEPVLVVGFPEFARLGHELSGLVDVKRYPRIDRGLRRRILQQKLLALPSRPACGSLPVRDSPRKIQTGKLEPRGHVRHHVGRDLLRTLLEREIQVGIQMIAEIVRRLDYHARWRC